MTRLLVVALAGCTPAARVAAPTGELPRWLSEAGVYADLATRAPGPGFVPYEPAFPRWSSGATVQRLARVPAPIDNTAPTWRFPDGTVLVETHTRRDVEGRAGDVAVETRVLARVAGTWRYSAYLWSADGREARRMEPDWAPDTRLLRAGGRDLRHTLPGALDCRSCHEAQAGPVLGISPLNTSPQMAEALPFAEPVTGVTAETLPGRTPAERAAMGYLVGNCVHCHNGTQGLFSMRPADLVRNTVRRPAAGSAAAVGMRVTPGRPDASALFEAAVTAHTQDRPRLIPMPPLGTDRPDPAAARVLSAWIRSL